MNADPQCLVPPVAMPPFTPPPWARKPESHVPPLPPQFRGNIKAKILWARMFIDANDSERPRWPSETEWARFPDVVSMVEELDRLDAELAREPDPRKRDALTEEILDIDAELRALVVQSAFPKRWLANIVSGRTLLHPRPEPQNGESVEEFDNRFQEWRRHRAATS